MESLVWAGVVLTLGVLAYRAVVMVFVDRRPTRAELEQRLEDVRIAAFKNHLAAVQEIHALKSDTARPPGGL